MHKSSGQRFWETKFYVACPPNLTVKCLILLSELVLVKPSLERRTILQILFHAYREILEGYKPTLL